MRAILFFLRAFFSTPQSDAVSIWDPNGRPSPQAVSILDPLG
jgi:hypothetical protein